MHHPRSINDSCSINGVSLRKVTAADLPQLYAIQSDPESCRMAMVNPRPLEQFNDIWNSILSNPNATAWVITLGDELAGSIGVFKMKGDEGEDLDAVGYAVARPYWGRGIATRALALALKLFPTRPLHARAASTNAASIRVLQNGGFAITGTRHSAATDRYLECDETCFVLK